jgi:rRNA maturation protein Nop10
MSGVTYFYETCPVCGRHLRIPVQHFGRLMECSHCGGEFLAGQPVPEESPARQSLAPLENGVIPRAHFGAPQCGEV